MAMAANGGVRHRIDYSGSVVNDPTCAYSELSLSTYPFSLSLRAFQQESRIWGQDDYSFKRQSGCCTYSSGSKYPQKVFWQHLPCALKSTNDILLEVCIYFSCDSFISTPTLVLSKS